MTEYKASINDVEEILPVGPWMKFSQNYYMLNKNISTDLIRKLFDYCQLDTVIQLNYYIASLFDSCSRAINKLERSEENCKINNCRTKLEDFKSSLRESAERVDEIYKNSSEDKIRILSSIESLKEDLKDDIQSLDCAATAIDESKNLINPNNPESIDLLAESLHLCDLISDMLSSIISNLNDLIENYS